MVFYQLSINSLFSVSICFLFLLLLIFLRKQNWKIRSRGRLSGIFYRVFDDVYDNTFIRQGGIIFNQIEKSEKKNEFNFKANNKRDFR